MPTRKALRLSQEAAFLDKMGHAGWQQLAEQWLAAMAAKRRQEIIAWTKFYRDADTLLLRC